MANDLISNKKVVAFLSRKNVWIFILKLIFATGIITYLVNKLDFNEIKSTLGSANLYLLLLAIFLLIPNLYLQYFKWSLICKRFFPGIKSKQIVISIFYGMSGAIITPFQIGEYVGRGMALKEYDAIKVVLATIVDKFIPLFVVTFAGAISMIGFMFYYLEVSFYVSTSLLILIVALFFLLYFFLTKRNSLSELIITKFGHLKFIRKNIEALQSLKNVDPNLSIKVLAISIIFILLYLSQFAILILAYGGTGNFLDSIWIALLVVFSKTIIPPISFGDLGIREGSTIYFCMAFGIASTAGFNAAFSIFLINWVIPSTIGLFLLIRKSR